MPDAVVLFAALASNVLGLAWLALGMEVHWQQVVGKRELSGRTVTILRTLGSLGLIVSLILCLWADHVSMASLVWIMALAGAALVVAFTLTWRPRTFAPLVAWA